MDNKLSDKEFLWGLYYSDYGAFLLNEGDLYKKENKEYAFKQTYELALQSYKNSLECRKRLLDSLNDVDDIQDAQNMMARSISNMGVALFRLERYAESLNNHKEALKIFMELNYGNKIIMHYLLKILNYA